LITGVAAVRDMDGKLVVSDRGRILVSFVHNTLGDADPSNDVDGPATYAINGPHTICFLYPCDISTQSGLTTTTGTAAARSESVEWAAA